MADHPSSIAGGCLCGSVRYTVFFPDAASWPPGRHTCQCTQCRKWTGALMASLIDLKASQLTFLSQTHFTEYSATKGNYRGFCAKCGSTLRWRSDGSPEEVEVTTGSLDQDVLVGEWGGVLARAADGHCWGENAVKGVTDLGVGGKVFVRGSGSGVLGGGGGGG